MVLVCCEYCLSVKPRLFKGPTTPVLQRFAAEAPAPPTDDPAVKMAHRQATIAGRTLYGLRK